MNICQFFLASGEDVTLDGDQPIVAWSEGGTLRITRFDAGGAVVWTRAFAGQAQITAMAVDPSHDVLFGGELVTVMDFGGGVLPTELNPDGGRLNGFVVKLSATGTHVFSRKTGYREVGGIASNSARIVVSSMDRPQYYELHLQAFDATGTPIASTGFDTGFGDRGKAHRVAIGASGRVWWNIEANWWPPAPTWPYLVVVSPVMRSSPDLKGTRSTGITTPGASIERLSGPSAERP
jgi:hypothetical protein